MKVCQLAVLVAALVIGALAANSPVLAAEGVPSDATLAAMGLSGLNVISDSEGLAVRGMGWTSAYGQSFAVVSIKGATAGSTNGYKASGKKQASGENFSFAGVEVKHGGGHGGGGYGNQSYGGGGHGGGCNDGCGHSPKPIKINAFAGGSSIGSRK